jgi:hypothetical protein
LVYIAGYDIVAQLSDGGLCLFDHNKSDNSWTLFRRRVGENVEKFFHPKMVHLECQK